MAAMLVRSNYTRPFLLALYGAVLAISVRAAANCRAPDQPGHQVRSEVTYDGDLAWIDSLSTA